ncbi:MAG: hypothetical protein AB1861_30780 [Cyanobacteriota bacterium]
MMLGAQVLTTMAAAQQVGAITEEQIWQATGQGGLAGQQLFAQRVIGMGAQAMRRGNQRLMAAAFYDPATGQFDEEAYRTWRTRGMPLGEMQTRAYQNIRTMGGTVAFRAQEGRIQGEFLRGTQGMGWVQLLERQFGERMQDPNQARLILRRYAGLRGEEADIAMQLIRRMPQIEQQQQETQRLTEAMQERGRAWQAMDPRRRMEAGIRSLREQWLGGVERMANRFVDEFTRANERGMADWFGAVDTQIGQEFAQSLQRMGRTTAGAQELRGRIRAAAGAVARTGALALPEQAGDWAARAGQAGAGLGGLWTRAQQWIMSRGAYQFGTPEELQRWGLGKALRVTESAQEALAFANTRRNAIVVAAQGGSFAVLEANQTQLRRLNQLRTGEMRWDDWGLRQTDVNQITSGTVGEQVRKAVLGDDINAARAAISEGARRAGKTLRDDQIDAIMTATAKKQGVQQQFIRTLGGPGTSWETVAGQGVGALESLTEVDRGQIEAWLQDPAYQDLYSRAMQGDRAALAEARERARKSGNQRLGDFLGRVEGNWNQASGAFGRAVGGMYMQYAEMAAKERQKFAIGLTTAWDRQRKTMEGRRGTQVTGAEQLMAALQGPATQRLAAAQGQIMDTAKLTSLSTQSEAEQRQAIQTYLRGASPAEVAATAMQLRGMPDIGASLAAQLEEESAYFERARKGGTRRATLKEAAERLATARGITDERQRRKFIQQAMKGQVTGVGVTSYRELGEEGRRMAELAEAVVAERGERKTEAIAEYMRLIEEKKAAEQAETSRMHPQTVEFSEKTIEALGKAVGAGVVAAQAGQTGKGDDTEGSTETIVAALKKLLPG